MRIVSLATNSVDKSSQVYKNQPKNTPAFKCGLTGIVFDQIQSQHLRANMGHIGKVLRSEMGCDVSTIIQSDYSVMLSFDKSPENIALGRILAGKLNKFADKHGIEASFKFQA